MGFRLAPVQKRCIRQQSQEGQASWLLAMKNNSKSWKKCSIPGQLCLVAGAAAISRISNSCRARLRRKLKRLQCSPTKWHRILNSNSSNRNSGSLSHRAVTPTCSFFNRLRRMCVLPLRTTSRQAAVASTVSQATHWEGALSHWRTHKSMLLSAHSRSWDCPHGCKAALYHRQPLVSSTLAQVRTSAGSTTSERWGEPKSLTKWTSIRRPYAAGPKRTNCIGGVRGEI